MISAYNNVLEFDTEQTCFKLTLDYVVMNKLWPAQYILLYIVLYSLVLKSI